MAQKVTNQLNNTEQALVIEALTYDKNSNYSTLEYYLKQIVSGRDVVFKTRSDTDFVVPATEAWRIISQWGAEASTNLPVGDRGSMRLRAGRLLDYIQINLIGKSTEAAASYRLILDQAKTPLIKPGQTTTDPTGVALQKAFDLRRTQIAELQKGLIGKLQTNLESTKFLKNIPDAASRALVLQMIAANNSSFRNISAFTPEKINQLLLHQPGYSTLNNAIHLSYSRSTQADFTELQETINQTIKNVYGTNEAKYLADMAKLRNLSMLTPTLSDVGWMIDHVAFAATSAEKASLVAAIRQQIVAGSKAGHADGNTILSIALKNAGLNENSLSSLESLAPYLEEIEVKQRHLILGSELRDRDARLLATSGVAEALGIDLTIPWLKKADLDEATKTILQQHGTKTLIEAYGKTNDPGELAKIKDLISKTSDYTLYRAALSNNIILSTQDTLAHAQGNLSAHPLAKLNRKIWATYGKVDNIIKSPAQAWIGLQEKYPLLDPAHYAINKLAKFQVGVASRIHVWAAKTMGSGGWLSGFAAHIADFTEGFITHEADWGGAGYFFIQRKWGNTLDWAAKGLGYKAGYVGFKRSIATTLWSGFNKVAPGLATKLSAGTFGKVVASFLLGELSAGTTIAIQIGWEALKFGFGSIKKFFTDSRFREKVLNWLPVALGGMITAASGLPLLFFSGIATAGGALLAFLASLLGSLVTLFSLAATWAFALVAGIALIFYIFKPTTQLDAGISSLIANIVCDDSGNTTIPGTTSQNTPASESSPKGGTLARASCLAKYLNQCYGQSVTSSNISKGLACLATYAVAPSAIEEVKNSATSFTYLQCVGFVKAVVAWAGGSISSHNACGYVDDPKFVAGLGGVKPGDAIVFKSSGTCSDGAPGHIGILKEDAGANICLIDANQQCSGCVVDGNCLPKTNVAGYLRL